MTLLRISLYLQKKTEESRLFTLQCAFLSLLKNSNEKEKQWHHHHFCVLTVQRHRVKAHQVEVKTLLQSHLLKHTHTMIESAFSGPFKSIKQSMHECPIVTQGSTNDNTRHTKTQLIEYRKVKQIIRLSLMPLQLIKTESGCQNTSPETSILLIE